MVKFLLLHFGYFALYCLLIPNTAKAQEENDYVMYLDTVGRLASEEHYDYTRVLKNFFSQGKACVVFDYYKSGQRKLVGTFSDKYQMVKTGVFMTYYENGKLESQISYEDDQPVGKCYFWYENGSKKAQCEFVQLKSKEYPVLKVEQFWSRIAIQRVVDGKGHFQDEDETSASEGELYNGFKHGEWWGTDYKDAFTFTEIYNNGELVSGVSTDSIGQKHPYKKIYIPAHPVNGLDGLYNHLETKMRHHQKGKMDQFFSAVPVGIVIEPSGKPKNITVLQHVNSNLKRQIISFIASYGNWEPAVSRGIKSEVSMIIPIYVRLQ
ncbi:toxin-antitoxin system YwqK family antitoxin [Flavobacterium sp.]|uniref:toxin-antitoxin system YwqK family antitoxin n=1 Tax=Flavobacterium sp. TaxID=239 RepID=UPI0039E58651